MGQPFGRYELLKRIAAGGMGEVYLARNAGLEGFEKLLVVKVLLPNLVEDTEFIDMFLDEARIAARLDHPNIGQIYDMGEVDGSYFIAMEYIRGDDVVRLWKQARKKEKPVPHALAVRIAADAAAGLDYAHKAVGSDNQPLNLVHRDVSPQNILVTFDGGVKLIDFGVAKAAGRMSHTTAGTIKGKYAYMSPEQITGMDIDNRSDIFALGVVLYEMLTGVRLFKRENEVQTITAVSSCDIPSMTELNPDIDPDLEAVVMKALAKERDDRYVDAQAFRLALEEWLIAKRQPGTAAHLSAYMKDLYAERLAEERARGKPYEESDANPSKLYRNAGNQGERSGNSNSFPRSSSSSGTCVARPGGSTGVSNRTAVAFTPDGQSFVVQLPQKKNTGLVIGVTAALVLAIGGGAAFIATRPAPAAQQAAALALAGKLNLITDPKGAEVYIDGVKLDEKTPIQDYALPQPENGAQTRIKIEVRKEGYLPAVRSVSSVGTQNLDFSLEVDPEYEKAHRMVKVTVASSPAGARVIASDGTIMGTTPLTAEKHYSEQPLHIRLELDGYQPLSSTISLQENGRVDLALAKVQVAAPQPKPVQQRRPSSGHKGTSKTSAPAGGLDDIAMDR